MPQLVERARSRVLAGVATRVSETRNVQRGATACLLPNLLVSDRTEVCAARLRLFTTADVITVPSFSGGCSFGAWGNPLMCST